MNINIKVTGIELTPAIRDYVTSKVLSLEKFLSGDIDKDSIIAEVEIGKTTNHHNSGEDVFIARINLSFSGEFLNIETTEADLYTAIDIMKDNMAEAIKKVIKKKNTLFRRGGRLIKRVLHGLKKPK